MMEVHVGMYKQTYIGYFVTVKTLVNEIRIRYVLILYSIHMYV